MSGNSPAFDRSTARSRVTPGEYRLSQRNATMREMSQLVQTRQWRSLQSAYDASGGVSGNWQSEWRRSAQVDPMPEFQVQQQSDDRDSSNDYDKEPEQQSLRLINRLDYHSGRFGDLPPVGACNRILARLVDGFMWQAISRTIDLFVTPPLVLQSSWLAAPQSPLQQAVELFNFRSMMLTWILGFFVAILLATKSQKNIGHVLFGFRCVDESNGRLASTGIIIAWHVLSIVCIFLDPLYLCCSSKKRTLSQRICGLKVVVVEDN